MQVSVASLSKKIISIACTAILAIGLMPSAACAAPNSLQSIPEGLEDAASIASNVEGDDTDVFSHCPSDDALFADEGSVDIPLEGVSDTEDSDRAALGGASASEHGGETSILAGGIINEMQPLQVIARQESTASYFLAQTLESTCTVPVVSAQLPIDTSASSEPAASVQGSTSNEVIEGVNGSDVLDLSNFDRAISVEENDKISPASTIVGSFTYLGMTFAVEPGGETVALVAVDQSRLSEEFIEKRVIVIPDAATSDGIDYYSVTRIARGAFATFSLNLHDEAGEAAAILVPSSVTEIVDDAFEGLNPYWRIVVADGNPIYVSEAGSLYNADKTELLFESFSEEAEKVVDSPIREGSVSDNAGFADAGLEVETRNAYNGYDTLITIICASGGSIEFWQDSTGTRLAKNSGTWSFSYYVENYALYPSQDLLHAKFAGSYGQCRVFAYPNDGYYFAGWEQDGLTFTATFAPGVTVYGNGGQITLAHDCNSATERRAAPHRYPLRQTAGQNVDSATFAHPSSRQHQARWNASSGAGSIVSDGYWSGGIVSGVSRTGYDFIGWSHSKDDVTGSGFSAARSPQTYYAIWSKCPTISWNLDGGTLSGQKTWLSRYEAYDLPIPSRTGYTFDGWFEDGSLTGTPVTSIAAGNLSDRVFYAKWTPITYTIKFDANEGTGNADDIAATYDEAYVLPSSGFSRAGYDFDGWIEGSGTGAATHALGQTDVKNLTTTQDATVIFYAHYTPRTYTITWNAQGGSVDDADKILQVYGNALSLPRTPTWEGYTFAGWWTTAESDPSEKSVGPGYDITQVESHNAEYFARWNKVSDKVTLKAAGGSFAQEQVDAFNDTVGTHPKAVLNEDGAEVELSFDVDSKSFSLDSLKPTLAGSTFAGWSPSFVPPTWNASTLSWNNAVTYTATWSTNSYAVTYQDKDGDPLVGWSAEEGGPSLESVLPQTFNEATPDADRVLPEKPCKLGYAWERWTWIHDGTEETVTSIPNVSNSVTIVAYFTADPYTVKVDLAEGEGTDWPEDYVRDYDDPMVELPADKPKRAGYVFSGVKAYASEGEEASAVNVIDADTNLSVDALEPGKAYRVLNLADGEGNVYDVKVLRVVWTPRIAVDVTPSVDMGILADFGTNTLKFQYDGTDYVPGEAENAYAPLEFVSYTTAPVGIVAVTDDTEDAGYAIRKAFAEKVFGRASNKDEVSFTIGDSAGTNSHALFLGDSTKPSASGFLDGLIILKPTGSETSKTTTFYLGMDFGNLTALDLLTKESGSIAKLYYTVAILKDDAPESEPSVLTPYDGNGILW